MRKLLYSVFAFFMAYNFLKPSIFAAESKLTLYNSLDSIYSTHRTHSSHYSGHVSHYSHFHIGKNDSISSINTTLKSDIQNHLAKESLRTWKNSHKPMILYRAYISDFELGTYREGTIYKGKALILVVKEDNKDNIWFYIPLKNNKGEGYFRIGHYPPLGKFDTDEAIYGNAPIVADPFELPIWLKGIINRINNDTK